MSSSSQPGGFLAEFFSFWNDVIARAVPPFLKLMPMYLLLTLISSSAAVAVLLIFGKAAFHTVCMFSPLIFIVIACAIQRISTPGADQSSWFTWRPIYRAFWRYSSPLALSIAACLNVILLTALVLGDLSAWRAGALPNIGFPVDLFSAEKAPLLLMLLTTATEQQLVFMPFLVVLGGKLEPHLIGSVIAGKLTKAQAFEAQQLLSKQQKFVLAPLRLLVILGVSLQYLAKDIAPEFPDSSKLLLLSSYFGWLMYACMLATISRDLQPGIAKGSNS